MKRPTAYLGVDPDTTTTGIALILPDGRMKVELVRTSGRLVADRLWPMARALVLAMRRLVLEAEPNPDTPYADIVLAVEYQHIRPIERNPNSMMGVQAVAGMALAAGAAAEQRGIVCCLTPIPSDWKGTVPKEAHQRRFLKSIKKTIDDPMFAEIPPSLRQHVVDALALAHWAKENDK